MEPQAYWAIAVFLVTCGLIVSEKIHRTIVAMIGAALMVAAGIVDQETAIRHIDFNTLGLLIGMMIIVGATAETGLFNYIAIAAAQRVKGSPMKILLALFLLTAAGSAFLDNVTTVLLMVPVTLSITRRLRVSPMPFLLTQIAASNIGGTATLIGDPPNIMIGSAVEELDFNAFIVNLGPIVLLILAVFAGLFALMFRKSLRTTEEAVRELMETDARRMITDPKLLRQSLIVLGFTILGFFAHPLVHLESATVALAGAFVLLLLTGEHAMERALGQVEWTTIFFFVGLFVLVSGLVETGVISELASKAIEWTDGDPVATSLLILWLSAIASAFLDNIPFVATMIPMIQEIGALGYGDLEPLWWSLALGACLGGNGALIGASANLIVAGLAAKEGCPITFMHYLKFGFPLMLLSIALSSVYIFLRYLA